MAKYLKASVVLVALIAVGVFAYSQSYSKASAEDFCLVHPGQSAGMAMATSVAVKAQDPQDPGQQPPEQPQEPQEPAQPSDPEADKYCQRPNPDGSNPDVGGVDPKKIGCMCARTCENGRPTENYQDGKRCKVHCKPDHCECPNPCKT